MKTSTKADLYLLLITVLWGATFPLIRGAVQHVEPRVFVLVRFSLASLLLLPLVTKRLKNTTWFLLKGGIILGFLNSGVYLFQTISMETISAARSAFITNMSVVLVPFIAPLFKVSKPRLLDIVCAFLALFGLYILTGADLHGLKVGDFWAFACAVFFALTIIIIHQLMQKTREYQLLTFYQVFFIFPFVSLVAWNSNFSPIWHREVLIAILYCAVFATVITLWIQAKYQALTTPAKAALIFCLEPFFAAILAIYINHEPIRFPTIIGGSIILLSIALPDGLMLLRNWRKTTF